MNKNGKDIKRKNVQNVKMFKITAWTTALNQKSRLKDSHFRDEKSELGRYFHNFAHLVLLINCADKYFQLWFYYYSSKQVKKSSHITGTVELGDKELFGHPKIVP